MERLQEIEVTFEDLLESRETDNVPCAIQAPAPNEPQIRKETPNDQIVTEELTRDVIMEELELPKRKVKDNLSKVCQTNMQNIIKCQVKAGISMPYAEKELKCEIDKSTKLEKLATECEFKQEYMQNKLSIEKADRSQLVREMETMDTIVRILNETLSAQENVLKRYKTDMDDYKNAMEGILNEYYLEDEAFKREFDANNVLLQKCEEEFATKQKEMEQQRRCLTDEKIALEQDIAHLQTEFAAAKVKNEELCNMKHCREEKLFNGKKSLLELKAKLHSVSVEELEMRQRKNENSEEINSKVVEKEILHQKISDRLDYLNEINKEIVSAKNKNIKLAEENTELKEEASKNIIKHEVLLKEVDTERLNYAKNLEAFSKVEKDLVWKLEETKARVRTTTDDTTKIQDKTKTLEEELDKLQSTIVSLIDDEENLQKEFEEKSKLHESYFSQKANLSKEATKLDEELSHLNAEKAEAERELAILQDDAEAEIEKLQNDLKEAKEAESILLREENEFENTKIEEDRKLIQTEEDNLAILKEFEDTLQRLKDDDNSNRITLDELSEKLQTKTDRKDSLHQQHKALTEEIERLEKEGTHTKGDHIPVKEGGSFQKPVGILKSPHVKSPQKKVTFDLNWDSVSGSSTDAFFDQISKKNNETKEQPKKVTLDDIFNMLNSNSPPEHELN